VPKSLLRRVKLSKYGTKEPMVELNAAGCEFRGSVVDFPRRPRSPNPVGRTRHDTEARMNWSKTVSRFVHSSLTDPDPGERP
jgi:hypothetical protein